MVQIFRDGEELSQALADRFVTDCSTSIGAKSSFAVALSGGHTPKRCYELLSEEPRRSDVEWSKVWIFWGDERNVPPSDPQSNEGMARGALLDRVPIPAQNIHPMFTGDSAADAAEAYESMLRAIFGPGGPLFDLVMLGMGPDGHTLSLFPGADSIDEHRWVVQATTETAPVRDRVTLTCGAIAISKSVVFAVEGADKAAVLKQVLDGNKTYPATRVAACAKAADWMIDTAAATLLT